MGFLWSVWVLFVGTASPRAADGLTQTALQRLFGYSLLTTGLGMFLRVVMLHRVPSHTSTPQESSAASAEAADRMSDALQRAAVQSEAMGHRLERALESLEQGIGLASTRLQERIDTHGSAAAAHLKSEIASASTALSAAIRAPIADSQSLGAELAGASTSLRDGVADLRNTLSSLRAVLAKSVESTSRSWQDSTNEINKATEFALEGAIRLLDVGTHLDMTTERIASLNQSIERLQRSIEATDKTVSEATARAIEHSGSEIAHADRAMSELRGAAERLYECTREIVARLEDRARAQ